MATQVAELVDVQMLFGQEVLNVFHFVDTGGAGSVATLVTDYVAHVVPLVAALQSTSLTHTAIRYRLVAPTADLQQTRGISPAVAGTDSHTVANSLDAYSIQFFLGSTVVLSGGFTGHLKRSGCRLAGVCTDNIGSNTISNPGFQTSVQTWFGQLVNPNGGSWNLCVASYLNGARVRQHTVQSYALLPACSDASVSTQNSRKVLRGRTS